MDFNNKVYIVTGASSGIGLEVSKKLSKLGTIVIIVSRNKNKLEIMSKSIPKSFPIKTDIREYKEIEKLLDITLKQFGKIDGIINNAGIGYESSIESIDYKLLDEILKTNLLGPTYLMSKAIKIMKKTNTGVIVNIASGIPQNPSKNLGPFLASKTAFSAISLTARQELNSTGIQINTVYPYNTNTSFEDNKKIGNIISELEGYGTGGYTESSKDSPELISNLIINAIINNLAEAYPHEWMKKN